jgi:kinesin family protein 1
MTSVRGTREFSSILLTRPIKGKYADQQKVFDTMGTGILDNAYKGYNCSLFAYGQTGSGKSYSMIGYG